ncbi:MAG: hypothetical protein KatS3mg044_0559 [Rhodothermaceae bacterium]|nr:MAG: hypothetical protein KatS3mg044_0559 [Rhodothermaceae bacterium]
MTAPPAEFTLELTPPSRFAVIDLTPRLEDRLAPFPRALFCSHHTTAGYLDQALCERLNHDPEAIQKYVRSFQKLFPPGADYFHDQLHLRTELSEAQRQCEPRNGDSHLTFISSGLESCVAYANRPDRPVFFIELDGTNGDDRRHRRTTIIGYNEEDIADVRYFEVPVSNHPIDSVNLRDPRLGLYDELQTHLRSLGITKGRIDLNLPPDERHAGLTVNEYETLLMRHDLAEVLQNPLRFMAEKGRNMLLDPRAIPLKARNYAKYDLVHLVNEMLDVLGLNESVVERIIDKFLRYPASRFLRLKRRVSLLVSDGATPGEGTIVHGTYQSPILVQWHRPEQAARKVRATFVRLT